MEWDARLASVAYRPIVGPMGPDGAPLDPAQYPARVASAHRVLYRSDCGAPLGIVGADYRIVQPRQVVEFFRDLTESHGWTMETAGCLKGGRVAWAMARCGEDFEASKGDVQRPFLLLSTSFDGSRATEARMTAVRVVCNNTISVAYHDRAAVKVRHSATWDAENAKLTLNIGDAWRQHCETTAILAAKAADQDAMREVIMRAYFDKSAEAMRETEEDRKRGARVLARIVPILAGAAGANTEAARGSLWGAVNAVTYDVDHTFPTRGANGDENRLNSAWFGLGNQIKTRALQAATAIAA